MAERTPPPDQGERDRVVGQLGSTLFVEAGAGSGKTTALVARIRNLILDGVELRSIAAITFTEKAGAELRDRLRRSVEQTAIELGADEGPGAAGAADEVVWERCRVALDQLDGAAIGTLHAFAQRILSEHPIEAGLPPRVEVLDEVSSGVAFERRWAGFQDRLLADPANERTILLLLAAGVRTDAFRSLARAFDQSWDLVEERVPAEVPEPPGVHDLLAPALAEIRRLCAARERCLQADDLFAARLDLVAEFLGELELVIDEIDLLDRLAAAPSFRARNVGQAGNWADGCLGDLRQDLYDVGEELAAVSGEVAQACAQRIGSAISRFTLAAAKERQAAGQLEFHDLLVVARALLRSPEHGAAVRAELHDRYRRLLLDEFQDTDPIQIELAVRIAAAEPASADAGTAPWDEVPVTPGHLFVVGDPKQSIYRFRRADIALFIAARERFGAAAGSAASLTANFRTGGPVIDWVNHTFAALMAEPPDQELDLTSQPDYVPLAATRPAATVGPPVAVLGRDEHPREWRAPAVREAEAFDVAATIARILAEGWTVGDGVAPDGAERWRPARLGDITVLVPARTSLPFLDDALGQAGIPYRAESSSIVYATRAIRDLLMVARAIDDPTDTLRLVAALRTPLFGCGDDDLARFRVEHGGRFTLGSQRDSVPAGDPVLAALTYLRELSGGRRWSTPSELLDRISRDRRAFELGFAEGRPRDVWRRHRFVIDQAGRGTRPPGGASATTSAGWASRRPKGPGWPSRSSPRPTTTRCGS